MTRERIAPMIPAATLLRAALLALAAGPAFAVCDDRPAAVSAIEAGALDAAVALEGRIAVDPGCGDDFRNWLNEGIARAYVRRALAEGVAPDARRADLEAALRHRRHWWIYAELGRTAFSDKDYALAGEALQLAINRLADDPSGPQVSDLEIQALFDLTASAVALAERPVPAPATRSGAPGGLLTARVRGFTVETVALPITFRFDSVILDENGLAYAGELLRALLNERPPRVVLAGHTDPVGPDAYNLDLSRRRVEEVGRLLREGGYDGEILIEWHGERVPPNLPAGIASGSEAHHRLARRVELTR